MTIEIMDTTLRDGEQTSGVSFTPTEKLNIAKMLLEEVKVDRIEVASARVSEGEFAGARKILSWAKDHNYLECVEILGFIDGTTSIDWIYNAGGRVVNLLSKGSENHLIHQLRKTRDEHVADLRRAVEYAVGLGMTVNLYLEDWSNGMRNSPDYVVYLIDSLRDEKIRRFMIPDTLGILNHDETYTFCRQMVERYPELHFDFHAHNDYDLATANVFAAVKAGVQGIHTTINGLGERAGNVPLSSVLGILLDHLNAEIHVDESKINKISQLVESFSGIRIPKNKPIIGENVFTQTCGVHADGDNKKNLYFNDLLPERFGRRREYALGKTAGKANILKNLQELGIELDPESMMKVTKRIIELGDQKESVTREDLPYIISDVLRSEVVKEKIKIVNYSLNHAKGLRSTATISIRIDDKHYEETAAGDGQYDAFMNALRLLFSRLNKFIPPLIDYTVAIPPGGKTDALVEALITWDVNGEIMKTRGLDPDQTGAAIKATMRMLNLLESGLHHV